MTHVRNECTGSVTGSEYLSSHGGHVSIREEVSITGGTPINDQGALTSDARSGTLRGIDILSTNRATTETVIENAAVEVVCGLQRLNIPAGETSARLETITGDAPVGSRVVFYGNWDGPITVCDGDDNIWLANGEHVLDGEFDSLELINRDGGNWIELSRNSP